MPPKKEQKKEVVVKEDRSGIPKNDVQFKFQFEVQQQNLQNMVLMWEWFSNDTAITERYDGQLIENWNQKDPNDPNTLVFEKDFDPIRVDDDFCKNLTKKEFYIYFVNSEDSKIKQEIYIDYSQLLSINSEKPEFEYSNNKLLIIEIEDFKFKLIADKPLLQPLYKHYLNPLEIEIVGAKDLPVNTDKKYEPCYVQYKFFDGNQAKTVEKLQKNTIKWGSKHVFLCGLLDQVDLVERIASHYVKMEVHDKDEVLDNKVKQELPLLSVESKIKEIEEKNKPPEEEVIDPKAKKGAPAKKEAPKKVEPPKKDAKKDPKKDAKKKGGEIKIDPIKDVPEGPPIEYHRNNYGVACFFLTDLLKPSVRSVKLRSPIVPVKKYEDFESNNLDLNTTAKKNIPAMMANSNFFDQNSFLVISLNLAHPFGTFKLPDKPLSMVQIEDVAQGQNQKDKKGKAAPPAPAKKEAAKTETQIEIIPPKVDPQAIYERAVYYMPYKSPELVQRIQDAFYEINMEAAKVETGGLRAITTKKLSEQERKDRTFDFLGGFEIIDSQFRLFVFEGLSSGAMKKLEEKIPRAEPNSESIKILKNSDVKFQERQYLDFDMEIKRIRLRENLTKILMKPDIYIRTKEPENICRTLNQISEIAKCWNIKSVAQFDLFPVASDLIAMERKYSDSLTAEDIHGIQIEVKKSKKGKQISSINDLSKTQMMGGESKANITYTTNNFLTYGTKEMLSTQQKEQISPTKNNVQIADNSIENEQNESIFNSKKNKTRFMYSVKGKKTADNVQIRIKETVPIPDDEPIYIYSSQKNNWYEKQKREQRERIRADKHNFYTYSEQYLTLSVDPFNVQDEIKLAETQEKTKLHEKPSFRPVPPKSKDERDGHPKKPHPSKIEELSKYPYYEQREKEEVTLKNTRGEPIKDRQDFNPYFRQTEIFSNPEVLEAEKIKPVEKEKQEREKKQKEQEEWMGKLKGTKYLYTKRTMPEHPSQLDKLKGLRDDPAAKKGLLLKNSRLKDTTLRMDRQLKDIPSSIFHHENFKEQVDPFARKVHPEICMSPFDFDAYQNPEIITKTFIYKPLKLDPMYK
ncbi:hypothetical protein ABPG72_004344 [Tetrahymena utriculariae]